MITEKENTRISKFLSLVLRHKPEVLPIALDDNGWTNVIILLDKMNQHGVNISFEILNYIVETNSKKRYAFNEDKTMIRASQGHSINVELGYDPIQPPAVLYHGTSEENVSAILTSGIEKRSRHHVHLSLDIETATSVGQRHGKPVIFEVDAKQMDLDGHTFIVSENKVWLTDYVPVKYIKLV